MKRTYKFELPKNKEVKTANVCIENGQLFVDIDFKEKFEPKDGDFLSNSRGSVFIYNGKYTNMQYGAYIGVDAYNTIIKCNPLSAGWMIKAGCRFSTSEEKSAFLERLEKECGKKWNAEKKCLEDVYVPKFGDIVRIDHPNVYTFKRQYTISIFPNKEVPNKCVSFFFDICGIDLDGNISFDAGYYNYGHITSASESEKQELFDKLAEVGKRWNPKTKKLEDIRWKPQRGASYYYIGDCGPIFRTKNLTRVDDIRISYNNCFKTENAAKFYADQIKEIFKNSKAE